MLDEMIDNLHMRELNIVLDLVLNAYAHSALAFMNGLKTMAVTSTQQRSKSRPWFPSINPPTRVTCFTAHQTIYQDTDP